MSLVGIYFFLKAVAAFLIAIFVLVTVHEFGHFIVARCCGVQVLKFSIGFGPALFSRTSRAGTAYVLGMIPLGGFVRMLDEREAPVPAEQLPCAFNRKPAWMKLAVVLAGPLFNFILAVVLLWGVYILGFPVERPVIQFVIPGSLAARAGIVVGSEIVSIDHEKTMSFEAVQLALMGRLGLPGVIELQTQRFGLSEASKASPTQTYFLEVAHWEVDANKTPLTEALGIGLFPKEGMPLLISDIDLKHHAAIDGLQIGDQIAYHEGVLIQDWTVFLDFIKQHPDQLLKVSVRRNATVVDLDLRIGHHVVEGKTEGFLGVSFRYPIYWGVEQYSVFESLNKALARTARYIQRSCGMFYKMLTGIIGVEHVRGPVLMAQTAGLEMNMGFIYFLHFLAVISIGLGVINLLPIPVLDGGHVVYYLLELLRGKPATPGMEKWGLFAGMLFLFCLMSLAFYNDYYYW
jgi:regulator of sigma E protease